MKNKIVFGYGLMVLYITITALSLITINTYEKTIAPENIALYSFLICTIFFNLMNIKNSKLTYQKFFASKSTFTNLNILTVIIWGGTFLGLKAIDPIFFVAIYMAVMPLTSSLINTKQNHNSPSKIALLTIFVFSICFLIKTEISGLMVDTKTLIGIGLGLLSGSMSSVYIHYTREIQAKMKLTTIDFLASRFYFTILLSLVVVLSSSHDQLSFNSLDWYKFFIVAMLTTIVPLFCLQKAISFLPPAQITYFMPLTPIATYMLQYTLGYPINFGVFLLTLLLTIFLGMFSLYEKRGVAAK